MGSCDDRFGRELTALLCIRRACLDRRRHVTHFANEHYNALAAHTARNAKIENFYARRL